MFTFLGNSTIYSSENIKKLITFKLINYLLMYLKRKIKNKGSNRVHKAQYIRIALTAVVVHDL
jgi:hypothetical protein